MGDGTLHLQSVTVEVRCRCGGQITGTVRAPEAGVVRDFVVQAFWLAHDGDECGPAAAKKKKAAP